MQSPTHLPATFMSSAPWLAIDPMTILRITKNPLRSPDDSIELRFILRGETWVQCYSSSLTKRQVFHLFVKENQLVWIK